MKKLWKKLVAVTTAVMMAVTLLPAMANAETTNDKPTIDYNQKGSITINKTTGEDSNGNTTPLPGADFTIYKIADLNKQSNEESNLIVSATVGNKNYSKIGDLLNLDATTQKKVAAAFADAVKNVTGLATQTATTADGTNGTTKGQAKFSELTLGYYLVVETKTPESNGTTKYVASAPFFVAIPQSNNTTAYDETTETPATAWKYDVVATPKNEEVSVDKKINKINDTEATDGQKATVAVGNKVEYEITSISPKYTPEYFTNDREPSYIITDTLSKGLDYQKDAVVKVGDATLTKGTDYSIKEEAVVNSKKEETGETKITITFTQDFLKNTGYQGKTVTVTYTAEVLPTAQVTDPNTNTVSLNYTNKPGEEATGVPGENVPKVYTYALTVYKKDNKGEALSGAKFKLYKVTTSDGEKVEEQIKGLAGMNNGVLEVSGTDAKLTFSGLNVGNYELEEVEAPDGYTLLKDRIPFTISDTDVDGRLDSVSQGSKVINVREDDKNTGYVETTVTNNKGFNLPATGGMGTYIFTIAGLVIMAGAAFLLIASRKRRA